MTAAFSKPHKLAKKVVFWVMAAAMLTFLIPPAPASAQVCSEAYLKNRQIAILNCTGENECDVAPGVGGGGSEVGTDFSLGTDPVQRRIGLMQALIDDYDLTPEQAAGILGNFMEESGGQHIPPDVNQGGPQGPPRVNLDSPGATINNDGYGWAQWSFGRKVAFIQFAIDNGFIASENVNATDAANYAYLRHEFDNTSEGGVIPALRQETTPEAAALTFQRIFERAGSVRPGDRTASARQAYNEYRGQSGSGAATGVGGDCPAGGGAAVVGDFAFPLVPNKGVVGNPEMFNNSTADRGGHPYIAYDILANAGVQVVAAMSGVVTSVTSDRCPGRMISIYNQESDMTLSYLHLAFSNHVALGQTVAAGDPVGIVGPASPNGCGTAHLHIDGANGENRPSCSRLNCPAANQAYFVDLGPQLFDTFQALPD